jgi:hypothetical protein
MLCRCPSPACPACEACHACDLRLCMHACNMSAVCSWLRTCLPPHQRAQNEVDADEEVAAGPERCVRAGAEEPCMRDTRRSETLPQHPEPQREHHRVRCGPHQQAGVGSARELKSSLRARVRVQVCGQRPTIAEGITRTTNLRYLELILEPDTYRGGLPLTPLRPSATMCRCYCVAAPKGAPTGSNAHTRS